MRYTNDFVTNDFSFDAWVGDWKAAPPL